jgi:hypothetical protein
METSPIRFRNEARMGTDRTHNNFAGEMGQVHTIRLSGGQWPNCRMCQGILLIGIN